MAVNSKAVAPPNRASTYVTSRGSTTRRVCCALRSAGCAKQPQPAWCARRSARVACAKRSKGGRRRMFSARGRQSKERGAASKTVPAAAVAFGWWLGLAVVGWWCGAGRWLERWGRRHGRWVVIGKKATGRRGWAGGGVAGGGAWR